MPQSIDANILFSGDNLHVMQLYIEDEFVDLVQLDRCIWAADVAVR
jgi:hypothetical protein